MDDELRLTLGATFDAVADGYDARPQYPDAIYTLLVDRCGLGIGTRVLEIGPATGLATMRLLDLGATVTAVEPGPALAARLRDRAAGRALDDRRRVVRDGRAARRALRPRRRGDVVPLGRSRRRAREGRAAISEPAAGSRCGGTIFGDPDGRPDPFEKAVGRMLDEHAPQLHFDAFTGSTPHGLDTAARTAEIDATGSFGPVEHHVVAWEGHHSARGIRRPVRDLLTVARAARREAYRRPSTSSSASRATSSTTRSCARTSPRCSSRNGAEVGRPALGQQQATEPARRDPQPDDAHHREVRDVDEQARPDRADVQARAATRRRGTAACTR